MDYTEFELRILLLVVIGVVSIVVYVITYPREKRRLIEALESIAIRRGGRLSKIPFRFPSLILKYRDKIISVSFKPGGRYSPPQTIVSASTNSFRNLEMHIFKEGMLFDILKKIGLEKEIEIDSDYFDSKFVIRGSDRDTIRNLLDYQIQERIIDIEYLFPTISISNGELKATVNIILSSEEKIEKLIDLVASILDRLDELNR